MSIEGLFTSYTIGKVRLANRFVMPGMQRGWSPAGAPSPELASYYRKRVQGGVPLVISESCAIDHPSASDDSLFSQLNPRTFDAWSHCVDAVRSAGGEMLLQLWHQGALRKDVDGLTLSPSGLGYRDFAQGRAATLGELSELRDAFVSGALLAKKAGASGVELHGAHGYLLDQFLWPETNVRQDEYGGSSLANRIRFPAELVAEIRAACGPDFLISLRFSQWKEHDYAARIVASPDELRTMVTVIRNAGANILHASTRRFWEPEWNGSDWSLAGWTRHLSGLPTITVGSVGLDTDVMESLTTDNEASSTVEWSLQNLSMRLLAGEFDLVSVGRSLISDADWVNKVKNLDFASIKPFRKSDIAHLDG